MNTTDAEQVKQYLAYWFQLGKKVVSHNGQHEILPQPVFLGDRYSPEFESCWQHILTAKKTDFYLEGTEQSIQELLSPCWELIPCARCEMPVPIKKLGNQSLSCPCSDLSDWPNTELPQPRSPVDSQAYLDRLRDRLRQQAVSTQQES